MPWPGRGDYPIPGPLIGALGDLAPKTRISRGRVTQVALTFPTQPLFIVAVLEGYKQGVES